MKTRIFTIGLFFVFFLSTAHAKSIEFIYPMDNSSGVVSSNHFTIRMQLSDPNLYNKRNSLHAHVDVIPLHDSANNFPVEIKTISWERKGSLDFATLRVQEKRILPRTVYAAKVRFYNGNTKVSELTDEYYTTTTGSSADDQMRTNILLRGFHEFQESELGKVGKNGTEYVDGTKYGASKKEAWCSEFYTWVTGPFLKGIKDDTTAGRLRRYFKRKDAYFDPPNLANRGLRGDYIAFNWDENRILDHSGMFLAWDRSGDPHPHAWTLEGNIGNKVVVKTRSVDEMDGFGHISGIDIPNLQACDQWCRTHTECAKCSTMLNCGVGYERIKSWTGAGTNWHACREKGRSKDNHEACIEWCRTHPECAKCSTELNCRIGYERIESWTKHGTNWYACREKEKSKGHHEACLEWCRTHPECAKCSTNPGCGIGYRHIKSWTGKGTNWHACTER
jgi:hypothetical protein